METIDYINGIQVINITDEPIEQATDEEKLTRLTACYSCEKYSHGACSECSCILEIRTSYKIMFCPIGKW
jgi:Family of unknown function (DUF6171)